MRRKIKYAAVLVLVFMPFIVWAAQKTITTYMWDSNIQVQTCVCGINPPSASPDARASTGMVDVTPTGGCSWTAASNNIDWLTVTSGASGTGNGTVTYSVTENTTGADRTGTIRICDKAFTVTQSRCQYALDPTGASFTSTGGPGSTALTADSGCSWNAVSNDPSWLTITSPTNGTGSTTVTYSVTANAGGSRTGTITIAGQLFTVTQGCPFTLTPTFRDHDAAASPSNNFTVTTTDCSWTAVSNKVWITTSSSGTGNGTVIYGVGANGGGARSGIITVADKEFIVNQAAVGGGGGCPILIADNFACKITGRDYVYIKVHLTDTVGAPVTDATVTYSIIPVHHNDTEENGSLFHIGNGWYSDQYTTFDSNCGLTTNCKRSNQWFRQWPSVTVTATRVGCSNISKTMTVGQ